MIDAEPTSDDEFRAALESLVSTAASNDVDVGGGWDVVTDGGCRFGVEVYLVQRSE